MIKEDSTKERGRSVNTLTVSNATGVAPPSASGQQRRHAEQCQRSGLGHRATAGSSSLECRGKGRSELTAQLFTAKRRRTRVKQSTQCSHVCVVAAPGIIEVT